MMKVNRFFENFWLLFSILTFLYACYETYRLGWSDGGRNFVIPGLAFMWWYFRKLMARKLEKHSKFRE
ncbi:MAG: hypothetical protein RLZZ262_1087 [Bacteroidota bacterium]|jgi:hypothetical protein